MKPLVVYNPGMGRWYVACTCGRNEGPRQGFPSAHKAGTWAMTFHNHGWKRWPRA